MIDYLWIAVGSALGGVGRHWLSMIMVVRYGEGFPWGTLLVNVTGSFLIGLLAVTTAPDAWRKFLLVGVLGGYTTFSSFSLQTLILMQQGHWARATGNVVVSVVACLLAVWLGYLAGQALTK